MRSVLSTLSIFLCLLPASRSSEIGIDNPLELRGVVQWPDGVRFVLYDRASKDSSTWLKLDSTWRFWTLKSYDHNTKQLTIVKGGRSELLSLRLSVIEMSKLQPDRSKQPPLLAGSFSTFEGAKVYSDDAKIGLGTDVVMTSPVGVMVSDAEGRMFKGDLEIETKKGKFFAPNATARQREDGTFVIEGKVLHFPPITRPHTSAVPK
jgi:hypothetical protein